MTEDFKNDMGDVTDDDKLWAALSLAIPIIGIIALLMEDKKDRPYIRDAAVHGLALSAIIFIIGLIPFVQCISPFIWFYMVYLAIQAYGGTRAEVPGLTDFIKGQGWI